MWRKVDFGLIERGAVVLFTRVPVPGRAKTRLMPLLTPEGCCLLQGAFILDVFSAVCGSGYDVFVCHTEEGDIEPLKSQLVGASGFFPQQGRDLGEKMHNAICYVLGLGFDGCVLVGSDIPLLSSRDISSVFELLAVRDVVIGPAEDGGYYLIGLKQPCRDIFSIEYGTSSVFEETVAAVLGAGMSFAAARIMRDIDEPEDLFWLVDKLSHEESGVCPVTREVLSGLEIGGEKFD